MPALSSSSGGRSGVRLKRMLVNGWQDLMRNKILSFATLLIIALMFFVFNIVLALSLATDSVILSVGKKVDIAVEVLSTSEDYQVQTVVNELKALPEVSDVIYVTKEEALARFGSKYPNVIGFLDTYGLENPLPDTLRIISRSVEDNPVITRYLERPQFELILDQEKLKANLAQKDRNEKILSITRFIKGAGFWLNITFALVAILIIFNSINISIHSHQSEINIMRLVGAKKNYVRGGFLFEGVLYAVIAFVISLILAKVTLLYLTKNLIDVITNDSLLVGLNAILLHFQDRFLITFGWQFIGALAVGLLSSYAAIELYLRKKQNF